jgi:hypothetical protein
MSQSPKRPRTISLVILLMVLLGAAQAVKAVALTKQSALLLDLQVRPDPRVQLLVAAGWAIGFWIVAVLVWRKQAVTRWLAPLLLFVHRLYELAVLALFSQVPVDEQRWIQHSLVTLLLVSYTIYALNRSAARAYFSEERFLAVSH